MCRLVSRSDRTAWQILLTKHVRNNNPCVLSYPSSNLKHAFAPTEVGLIARLSEPRFKGKGGNPPEACDVSPFDGSVSAWY